MALDLVISPIVAPTLTGLSAVATIKGILVTWDALKDTSLFAAELWVSETNDRAAATLLQTCTANYYMHTGLPSSVTRYYWIRAKNIHERTDGAWTPVSPTAGVSATTLLTQTSDLNPNAATSISLAQSSSTLTQTNYGAWELLFRYTFLGTGSDFLIEAQHLSNFILTTIGTSGLAQALQTLDVVEHTVYGVGTVSVTNGSAVVIGVGTTWLTNLSAGNTFVLSGVRYTILSVDSDTQITLVAAYAGSTLSGQAYMVITASASKGSLSMKVAEYEVRGSYCLSYKAPFRHRLPVSTVGGKLYDCDFYWAIDRSNTTWAISQTSVLKTVILEEIKR